MAFRAELTISGSDGAYKTFVFDDDIAVGEPSKPAAGLYFSALGGLVSVVAGQARNRRVTTSIEEAMSAMPDPTGKAVAAQARLLAIYQVTQVRLEPDGVRPATSPVPRS